MVTLEQIKEWVEQELSVDDLSSKTRDERHVGGRAAYFKIANYLGIYTDDQVAKVMGRKRCSCSHYRGYMAGFEDSYPFINLLFKRFKEGYKFLLSDNCIAETDFNVYDALMHQMEVNKKLQSKLLLNMIVSSEEVSEFQDRYSNSADEFTAILAKLDSEKRQMVYDRMIPIVRMAESAKFHKQTVE